MITGAYVENTSGSTLLASANNLTTPDTIITQMGFYFVVERILMVVDGGAGDTDINSQVEIKFLSSNRDYSNTKMPIQMFLDRGIYNSNGKPVIIIPPEENISIIYYNEDTGAAHTYRTEFSGYYIDSNGLRAMDGQTINRVLINTIL